MRKSGRVRVHKSKENPNGTFSIGKTWDLNDLTAIDSFTAPSTSPDFRQWAGNVGFVVSLGKPYYWQAQTDKEKKFFIASLLKIYGKYTGGRVPILSGFDQQEMDQIQGGAQRRPAQPPTPIQQQLPPPSRPPAVEPPPQNNLSVGSAGYGPASGQSDYRAPVRSPMNGASSPAGSIDSGRSTNQAAALRRLAGSNKSQDSVAASFTARSDDGSSIPPRSRNGPVNGSGGYGPPPESPAAAAGEKPPARRRPPMDPTRPQGAIDDGLVPAPLSSTRSRDQVMPPPRSSERMSPRKASAGSRSEAASLNNNTNNNDRSPAPPPDAAPSRADIVSPLKSPLNGTFSPVSSINSPAALDSAGEPLSSPEELRPGLGPMIRKNRDVAGAFRKAAAAATSFKPRPGGAAERFYQAQNKTNGEPDGITGVVPAPPRPVSVEKPKPVPEERPKTPQRTSIPEVKVTVPQASQSPSRPASAQPPSANEQQSAKPEPEADAGPRRSIIVGNDVKYLSTLGVDPSMLDNRSVEFAKWLDYFGWVPGDQMRSLNFDEMKVDMDRELNKAQAGGWLARFQEEDERVGAIKKGIDVAMAECEEMDNLLTLYSVELSVRPARHYNALATVSP